MSNGKILFLIVTETHEKYEIQTCNTPCIHIYFFTLGFYVIIAPGMLREIILSRIYPTRWMHLVMTYHHSEGKTNVKFID